MSRGRPYARVTSSELPAGIPHAAFKCCDAVIQAGQQEDKPQDEKMRYGEQEHGQPGKRVLANVAFLRWRKPHPVVHGTIRARIGIWG